MKIKCICIPAFLLVISCAGSPDLYREIDAGVQAGSFSAALDSMESRFLSRKLYNKKNSILYYLDRGMIEHYAGLWEESSGSLETGERLIEDAFTRSLFQEIGTYIANDNVRDYAGEDYEDIYINVFNALNYYRRGDLEGALVEVRRVNEKLQYLSDKYEVAIDKVKESNDSLSSGEYAVEAEKFSNSALARYLGILFYRAAGNGDSARIDREELYQAFELAPSVYYNSVPSSIAEELEIPEGKARFNVICFTGLAPVKEEVNLIVPLPFRAPNNFARIALPEMKDRPHAVRSIEVVYESGPASGRVEMELLEDMGMVARETFKARYALVLLKTVARTIIKNSVSAGIAEAASEDDSGFGLLFGFLGKLAVEASESADIRISRYFPSRAYVGGINLEPGVYSVRVNYYGAGGLLGFEQLDNVPVLKNKLNLTEFVCLQ